MLGGVGGDLLEIRRHARCQKVGADKVRRATLDTPFVVAADVAILLAGLVLIPLLVKDAAAVGAEQYAGEQSHFIIAVGAFALLAKLLHSFPCGRVDDGLVGVLEYHLLFFGIFHARFYLVGDFLGLEVHRMP